MEEKIRTRQLELAEHIKNILACTQMLMLNFSVEELKDNLNEMRKQTSILESLPFPETLNKAEGESIREDLFEAIINLVEKQKVVLDYKKKFITGKDILKMMGL